MFYTITNTRNNFILAMKTIQSGECDFLKEYIFSYAEPALLLGYYDNAPSLVTTNKKYLQKILASRILCTSGEGPHIIALDPHVDRSELQISRIKKA
jgi:hypothetical protein